LLTHPDILLSETAHFLGFFALQIVAPALHVLEGSQKLLVFPVQHLFAFFAHFELLLKGFLKILDLFHFFVSGSVLEVPDFLFEIKFVADENVIEFFVFEGKILN
jgi:hypothetical protein